MTTRYRKLKKPLIAKLYTKDMAPATKLYYTNSVFRDRVNYLRRTKPHLNRYQTLWIAMLQHRIFPYASGTLESEGGGRCCLGVACTIIPDPFLDMNGCLRGNSLDNRQPTEIMERLQLGKVEEAVLMAANDVSTSSKYPVTKRHRYIAATLIKPEFWGKITQDQAEQIINLEDVRAEAGELAD